MNNKINQLIPVAIQAIDDQIKDNSGNIPKEFKGYISSMGASVIQSGLIATLAFYANDSGKKADSSHLLKAIYQMMKPKAHNKTGGDFVRYVIRFCTKKEYGEIKVSELNTDKLDEIEDEISDCLVALKLGLRTFKINS